MLTNQYHVDVLMKFDLMTMIALLAAASLVCAGPSSPYVVFGVVMVGLPVAMMLIAISSPKQGTSLNVTSRWYFFLLGKTWCFTVGFCVLAFLVIAFFVQFLPGTSDRIRRISQGDFRARVVFLQVDLKGIGLAEFKSYPKPIYDERGLVGECRSAGQQTLFDSNTGKVYMVTFLKIHTDRTDLLSYPEYEVQLLNEDKILLTKANTKKRR